MHLAKTRWQAKPRATLQALLPANSQAQAKLLVKTKLLATAADWRPSLLELQANLRVMRRAPQPAKLAFPELQAPPQDWLLPQAPAIPRAQVRARQCLQGPGPFAFFREILADRKCNRAARCGDCPTSARYRRRCNRRGLVGYGNRRSRLLRKRARPG